MLNFSFGSVLDKRGLTRERSLNEHRQRHATASDKGMKRPFRRNLTVSLRHVIFDPNQNPAVKSKNGSSLY